jgi:nucleolar protein 12
VESALLLNDKKFPPLLPRKLRVMRSKNIKRNPSMPSGGKRGFEPDRTMTGRAGKLLGRAGASQIRHNSSYGPKRQRTERPTQTQEKIVFEGVRAKNTDGNKGLKFGSKRKGKPKGRKTERSSSWRNK